MDTEDTNSEFAQLTAEPPTRISTPMQAGGGPPPGWKDTKTNGGTLNLPRAQHIIRKLTDDPSWLIDPSTSHAAQAVFGAASKVVGMNIQMEKAMGRSEANRIQTDFTKQKFNDLSRVTPFIPGDDVDGQAELGRLNGMVGTEDFNLQEFSTGVARLQSKYSPKPGAESLTMEDGTVLQGYRDRFGNFHQSAMQTIEARDKVVSSHIQQRAEAQSDLAKQRFGFQKDILDRKEFVADLNLEAKTRLKRMDEMFTDSQKEIDELRKAGVKDYDPRMLKVVGKQAILGLQQNDFLDKLRPAPRNAATNSPAASSPPAPVSAPSGLSEGQRVRNRVTGKMGTVKGGAVVPDTDPAE